MDVEKIKKFKKKMQMAGKLPTKPGQEMDVYGRYIPDNKDDSPKFDKYGNLIINK